MSRDIKTRRTLKDIKVLDKAAVSREHIRNAYVQVKDMDAKTKGEEYGSPTDYAQGQVSGTANRMAGKAANQAKQQGRKAIRKIKIKRRGQESVQDVGTSAADTALEMGAGESAAGETVDLGKVKAAESREKQVTSEAAKKKERIRKNYKKEMVRAAEQSSGKIKTRPPVEKSIKQPEHSIGRSVKSTTGSAKTGAKRIKTAEQTAKTAIKATRQGVQSAQQMMQMTARATRKSVQTSQKAVQASRQATKVAEKTTKAAVKATMNAVRAIISSVKSLVTAIAAGGWIAVFIILVMVVFGGFFILLGGNSSSSASPVSEEVQAYDPLIRKYAAQHGIPEYVELIKAVMMQESGGRGNDPMQASECGYNKKYPNTPNGITDPEYSVDVGIQNLAACLQLAGVQHPVDIDHIKTALQGYNYGNGYISWAIRKYGGYSVANAIEFSDMMASRLGWSSYGDKEYVPHVLQYYSYGNITTGFGNQAIVQVALSQEGNVGGQPYWSWYGFSGRVAWCACFVSWCADQCGYIEAGTIPKFSLCMDGEAWFKSRNQWQDGSYVPSTGDIIFFDWGNDGRTDHVGIVVSVGNGVVNTIEGNSGNACRQRSYTVGSRSIYGYGIYH